MLKLGRAAMGKIGEIKLKYLLLALILSASFWVRVYRLDYPEKYYFDEVYHALTAGAYARNDPAGYEWWHTPPVPGTAYEWLHPPISKLLMAGSIRVVGDVGFGWRLPSAMFGVLVIWAVWWMARALFEDEWLGLVAAFLASLDGLLLAQSRIAMNDIFVTFFMVVALGWYWRWKKSNELKKIKAEKRVYLLLASVFTGLAVATKWSGVFVVGVVGIWEVLGLVAGGIKISRKHLFRFGQRVGLLLVSFAVIPAVIYVLSYGQFWLQGHTVKQFEELHNQIWWYETHLDATHPYQSRPWQWVLDLKPVWFHVEYLGESRADIYNLANPVIAWGGLSSMVWVGWRFLVKKKSEYLFLIICYLVVWLPWVASPRIMFFYHYSPAIPFLSMALALLVVKLWRGKGVGRAVGLMVVGLAVAGFIYFFPRLTGMPIPNSFAEQYVWFESWK